MKDQFVIDYQGLKILIEQQKKTQHKNLFFMAHLPQGNVIVECLEDNDGARRWFDKNLNHETQISKEIGEAIDIYIIENNMNF